jgi:polar amino acid transport system substrate-binding protein
VVENIASPFQLTRQSLSQGGIITDIVHEIFQGDEYQLEARVFPIKRLYKTLEDGLEGNWISYDAKAWNSLSRWGNLIDLPLFQVKHSLLTCESAPKAIHSDDDLKSLNIAVLKNFRYPEMETLANQHRLTLYPVSDYTSGFQLVRLKRISGFVEMDIRLRYHLLAFKPKAKCLHLINMDKIIAPYNIYLSLSKSASPQLIAFIKNRLEVMKAKGRIKAIIHQYIM